MTNNSSSVFSFEDDEDDRIEPLHLSQAETILHLVCLSQGIPINLVIGLVIVRNQRLHNPRNAFWLGIIAMNLLTMMMAVLKLTIVHFLPGGWTCLVFSFLTGKPYTILLFILLLATFDRYVAITYPLYHHKHVTVKWVIVIQLACFFVIFFLLSLPRMLKWLPLKCGFSLTLGKWTMLLRLILVVLCIATQVKVYLQTRKYLRQAPDIPLQTVRQSTEPNGTSPGSPAAQGRELASSEHSGEEDAHRTHSVLAAKNNSFFVHRRNKTVSKLELEASVTLVIGVLSLCVITAPMFVVYFSVSICHYFECQCSQLESSVPYVRQAALIHAVYGPLIYIIRSREFTGAIRRMLRPNSRLSVNYI